MLTIDPDKLSDTSKKAVRLTFNPSGNERVQRLKTLAAALITEYEAIREDTPAGAREASVAITNMQTTSMWGVLAATAALA